jgi:hypothetical protein
MKKWFGSLMVGFGATLGVFVALAMPPGGWGVAIGVGLGLLGCVPLLLIIILLIGRNNNRRHEEYSEAQQPVIIVQQPPAMPQPDYYNYMPHPQNYGYMPQPQSQADYYGYEQQNYQVAPPRPRRRPQPMPENYYYQNRLPEADYDYYEEDDSYDYEPEYGYYADPRQQPYEPYYPQPQSRYRQPEPPRARSPRRTYRQHTGGTSGDNGNVVEANYRTIGD